MIKLDNVSKKFGQHPILEGISAVIRDGSIFGLIGSNGSGKSTLLRILCGVYRADSGHVTADGQEVYENVEVKRSIVYLSDEQYFLPFSTINDMIGMYASVYPDFDVAYCNRLCTLFKLPADRKINTFSKGMQKQVSVLLGLSARPKYLLCDETFDGLDPVVRQLVRRLLAEEAAERKMTAIIASHNLRELEDICDHVGLLHMGGILFESEMDDLKTNIHKVQAVFRREMDTAVLRKLDTVRIEQRGSLYTIIARGSFEEVDAFFASTSPLFYEVIPLTLEEIFISEMGDKGYDFSEILL